MSASVIDLSTASLDPRDDLDSGSPSGLVTAPCFPVPPPLLGIPHDDENDDYDAAQKTLTRSAVRNAHVVLEATSPTGPVVRSGPEATDRNRVEGEPRFFDDSVDEDSLR